MTTTKYLPEDDVFAAPSNWLLISRVITDVKNDTNPTVVHALPVKGAGVFIQTLHADDTRDEPVFVPGVMILEYKFRRASSLTDAGGAPMSQDVKCVGREIVTPELAPMVLGGPPPKDVTLAPGLTLTIETSRDPAEDGE